MIGGDSGRAASGVTLDNWQTAPQLAWSFQHIADIFPTAVISRGTGPVAHLPAHRTAIADIAVRLHDGNSWTVGGIIDATVTDGWIVVHDGLVLAEEFVAGEELTAGFLGDEALPLIRIEAPQGNYDYQNKYFTDDVKYQCPSGLPEAEEREIQRIVVQAYRTLGCRGWGRADLMIRASDRKPFLLEMNTSPGMTSHSLVPMSARAAGISYEQLCVGLLQSATLDARAAS